MNKYIGNNLIWKNPLPQENEYNENQINENKKLYDIMIWYADCKELIQIINSNKLKDKMIAISELENLKNTKSILDYITYYQEKNEELGEEKIKEINRILRAELIEQLLKNKMNIMNIITFLDDLNNKKERKELKIWEFYYTYEIANKHTLTTKLIQPIFEIEDGIYIAFRFEKGNYYRGKIFENTKVSDKKLDDIKNDIMNKKYKSMTELFINIIIKFLITIKGGDIKDFLNIKTQEELEKILSKIWNKEKDMKKTIERFRKCLQIGNHLDELIKKQNEIEFPNINFDDLIIFKNVNNNDFDLIKYIKENNVHPFLYFFILNNLDLVKTFIKNILKQSYIEIIFNNKIDYIPFWVFVIRNISSRYCIIYGEKNNIFYE